MKRILKALCLSTLAAWAVAGSAQAETVKIAVTVPTTAPAAILGLGARNAISLFPKQVAGYDLDITVLDDASDITNSVKNAKQFLGDKADLIVGSSTSPQSLAIIEFLDEVTVPRETRGE